MTALHLQSEHDFQPDDVGAHGENLLAYFGGEASPQEPHLGPLVVVNPAEAPPTGWGPPNRQQFQTGFTNNVPTKQSMEQGMGVGPERAWPHYPHAENPNVFRNLNCLQRAGTDAYSPNVYRPEAVAYWQQAIIDSISISHTKMRSPVTPVVDQAPSTPYVSVIPQYNAGGY